MGVCGGVSMHVHKQSYIASVNEASCCWCSLMSDSLRAPMDCSLPGSSVHGVLQARILEWVAVSYSRASSQSRIWNCASCISCMGKQILYCMHHLGSPTKPLLASKLICPIAIPLLWLCLSRSYSQRQTIILRELFKPIETVFSSVQFSSITQSCPTLCNPMNHSMPGLPVHHQLPEFTQTHVHRVGDAIQPSHPLLSPSPPAPNPSQHQDLFQWVSSSHQVAKVLEFQLQHQSSSKWTPRTALL